MATWPAKINYATGDVLTAAQMNTIGGELNDLDSRVTAAGGFWKNPVLNSNFSVWQRGTSIAQAASTTAYTADRWSFQTQASQASVFSRQSTNDTTNLPNIQYCARVQRNSGQTGTGTIYVANSFESINSIPFAGKAVTVSFYARAGANYSAASSLLPIYLWSGTGTDQNVNGGYTGAAIVGSVNATLTTTWQRFTFTGTVASTATELALQAQFIPVGTAGANDYFEFTGVQLEVGSSATSYYPNGNTYQAELAACQRYAQQWNATSIITGFASSTTVGQITIGLPVALRNTTLTVTQSGYGINDLAGGFYSGGTWAVANNDTNASGIKAVRLTYTHGSAALTQFRPYVAANTDGNSTLLISAEL